MDQFSATLSSPSVESFKTRFLWQDAVTYHFTGAEDIHQDVLIQWYMVIVQKPAVDALVSISGSRSLRHFYFLLLLSIILSSSYLFPHRNVQSKGPFSTNPGTFGALVKLSKLLPR